MAEVVFGRAEESLPRKVRPCVYVLATDGEGRVAAVVGESGKLFLPGGGMEDGETEEEALQREVREELGLAVRIGECVGRAVQHFVWEGWSYEARAAFFDGVLGERLSRRQEHELRWCLPAELFHAHHVWAASERISRG